MKLRVWAVGEDGFGVYEAEMAGLPVSLARLDCEAEHVLLPGFIDIHIHGAYGIDFMSATSAEMNQLCDTLAQVGYEGFLPTTVTADAASITKALSNLPDHPMILGFHLEGPFISPDYPGAQPQTAIAAVPFDGSWDEVLNDSRLRIVTLAPEKPGAVELVKRLVGRAVSVSLGHSAATYSEAEAAAGAGATHATHTFNAMKGFHHREAGLAGFAMLDDRIYTELIYDRIHVSEPSARLLLKTKPQDKVVAVSDSTMATGLAPGSEVMMWGLRCITSAGQVRLAENGALAGSAITLMEAFRNLASDFGLETAIRLCAINPRLSIGLHGSPRKYLVMNKRLDLVEIIQ